MKTIAPYVWVDRIANAPRDVIVVSKDEVQGVIERLDEAELRADRLAACVGALYRWISTAISKAEYETEELGRSGAWNKHLADRMRDGWVASFRDQLKELGIDVDKVLPADAPPE